MRTIKYLWLFLLCCLEVCAIAKIQAQEKSRFVIDPKQRFQKIDHFGASDCWSFQFIGLWPKPKVDQIADWLFSTDFDANGKPKGIGLSLWRFNIGAGSSEQGAASRIESTWRRSECFLTAQGTYDWSKQRGQREFMKLAKERGVSNFLGFMNSPPVYYTQNGLATNLGRGANINLRSDAFDGFAAFMANVVDSLALKDGIKLNYISPINEPDGHWNWTGTSQEGTPALNTEVAHLVNQISQAFLERKLATKIVVPESSDYNCVFRTHPLTGADRGNHVQTFFNARQNPETSFETLPNVSRLLLGHSYWTTTPVDHLKAIRRELNDSLQKYHVGFWESEYCIMSNDQEIGGGPGFDPTMKTALYVARIIHHDLVWANAQSWQWWLAIGGDYKDGLMRGVADPSLTDGHVDVSKLMWVLGNYSRFIRPGAVRVGVSAYNGKGHLVADGDTDPIGLMVSAYQNTNGTMVVVVVNYSDVVKGVNLGVSGSFDRFDMYRTSDVKGEDLLPVGVFKSGGTVRVAPRSVTTFVGKQ